MQISGLSGVSAYNSIARINSSSQTQSIPLPDYGWPKGLGMVPTHTTTNRSDDEVRNAIIELAKQDAQRGVNGQNLDKTLMSNKPSAEYHALQGEFVQSVSPDRRSIFPATVALMQNIVRAGKKPLIDDSLTQLFLNGTRVNINKPGGTYDAMGRLLEISTIPIQANGVDIGYYDVTRGWGWTPTEAESSRMNEISSLYRETWRAETAKVNASKSETSAAQAYSGSFVQPQAIQSTTAQQAISRYEQMQPGN